MDERDLESREELNGMEELNGVEERNSTEIPSVTGEPNYEGVSQDSGLSDEEPIVITEAQVQAQEKPKEEKKSSKAGAVFGCILLIGLLAFCGVIGIRTLLLRKDMKAQSAERAITLEKGTWTKFQARYATPECVELKHTVNFIPTAREHFFLVFSADFSEMALVRADKSWFEENFTDEWVAKDADGVTVEGFVRKTEYKVKDEADKSVKTLVSELGRSFRIDTGLFIDLNAVKLSIYEILIMVIPILVGGLVFLFGRKSWDKPMDSGAGKVLIGVLIVGFFVYGGFVIHVLALI